MRFLSVSFRRSASPALGWSPRWSTRSTGDPWSLATTFRPNTGSICTPIVQQLHSSVSSVGQTRYSWADADSVLGKLLGSQEKGCVASWGV